MNRTPSHISLGSEDWEEECRKWDEECRELNESLGVETSPRQHYDIGQMKRHVFRSTGIPRLTRAGGFLGMVSYVEWVCERCDWAIAVFTGETLEEAEKRSHAQQIEIDPDGDLILDCDFELVRSILRS